MYVFFYMFNIILLINIDSGSTSSEHSQDKVQQENAPLEAKFPDLNYEYIEGRNFKQAKGGKTELLPCDDEECERLEIVHIALK